MTDVNARVSQASERASRRLSRGERRLQLLHTALTIVKQEGADELTLGTLARRAAISKPVVYDHFPTRDALLIELYRWIDTERVEAFRAAMSREVRGVEETVAVLAATYIRCASETEGEFQAVGAALAGSAEKIAVFQELLDNCVRMFVSVLTPHVAADPADLERLCIGLVGAGEALSAAIIRGNCTEEDSIRTFAALIRASIGANESA